MNAFDGEIFIRSKVNLGTSFKISFSVELQKLEPDETEIMFSPAGDDRASRKMVVPMNPMIKNTFEIEKEIQVGK